jgi:hypothetical protein
MKFLANENFPLKPYGVLLYRLNEFTEEEPADRLLEILSRKEINLEHQFSVLDDDQIRQRPL